MVAFMLFLCSAFFYMPVPVAAQSNAGGAFLGTWCAQGDPAKRTSITTNGVYLTLTNELGSTSIGRATGTQIEADEWQFVRGTLSSNGKRIDWTNGTYWTRCSSHRHSDLRGTWYFGGDRSKPCRIDQHDGSLSLRNESGQTATGSFTSKDTISTVWAGVTITGTISRDRTRILWSNGTYWMR
jgi:hypothetical protein